jgi:hypothetical protein
MLESRRAGEIIKWSRMSMGIGGDDQTEQSCDEGVECLVHGEEPVR